PVDVHLRDPVLPAVPGRRRQPCSSSGTAAPGRKHGGCRSCSPARSTGGCWNTCALPAGSRPCPRPRGTCLAGPARLRRRPAPCPVPGGPAAGRRPARPPLRGQARRPAQAGEDPPVPDDLLAVQDRLLRLPDQGKPDGVMSVGQPAASARYFADLRLVCSLLNGAWPHSQNLITGASMAECLGRYIASTSGVAPRRHTLCGTPPLDPHPAAAL